MQKDHVIRLCIICLAIMQESLGIRRICTLPRLAGHSRCLNYSIISVRYFFDASTMNCRAFEYFGCEGNSNNFRTRDECFVHCNQEDTTTTIEQTTETSTIATTMLPTTIYEPPTTTLTTTTSTTAPPTTVTTTTSSSTSTTQDTTKANSEDVCTLAKEHGVTCLDGNKRRAFFFEPQSGTCQSFQYNGCGGNSNRFADVLSCCMKCVETSNLEKCGVKMIEYRRSMKLVLQKIQ